MTFTEQIYDQINSLSPLSTDDFSIHWLGQSRSYDSSNKARGLEASNSALVKLMNKLLEQRDVNQVVCSGAFTRMDVTPK